MYEAVAIGSSAGGMQALRVLLGAMPASFPLPIAIVQHIEQRSDTYLAEFLDRQTALTVKEADDKEIIRPGTVYIAPAGYHLLIEPDRSFSLSVDEKVNYCRPAIDVLFESAADTYGPALIGIVLTGANSDGAKGLKAVKGRGGMAIVQNPQTAQSHHMPQAAIDAVAVDHVADIEGIGPLLLHLARSSREAAQDRAGGSRPSSHGSQETS